MVAKYNIGESPQTFSKTSLCRIPTNCKNINPGRSRHTIASKYIPDDMDISSSIQKSGPNLQNNYSTPYHRSLELVLATSVSPFLTKPDSIIKLQTSFSSWSWVRAIEVISSFQFPYQLWSPGWCYAFTYNKVVPTNMIWMLSIQNESNNVWGRKRHKKLKKIESNPIQPNFSWNQHKIVSKLTPLPEDWRSVWTSGWTWCGGSWQQAAIKKKPNTFNGVKKTKVNTDPKATILTAMTSRHKVEQRCCSCWFNIRRIVWIIILPVFPCVMTLSIGSVQFSYRGLRAGTLALLQQQ